MIVGLPLLIVAFSVERPAALPAPTLPPTFDGAATMALSEELSRLYPDRAPGTAGSLGATRWLIDKMRLYGFKPQVDAFDATIPGRGRVLLRNVLFTAGPQNADAIVVMAHRDDSGLGAGANDNASGTAALIELARGYATPTGTATQPLGPQHRLIFLSTDGGAFGGIGAARFAQHYPDRNRVLAVVNLDSIGGKGKARLEVAADQPRSPAPLLVESAAARITEQSGTAPGRTSALGQLTDLGFPFSLYEQAPLVGRGIPAITITTSGNRPPATFGDTPERLHRKQVTDIGRASQALLGSLDEGLDLARGTHSYVFLGSRLVRGWAIEFALVAMLLPFVVVTVDLFARCRRRKIPVAPALRAYRSRLGFWLWVGAMFLFLGLVGVWPGGAPHPINPETAPAGNWPALGLILLLGLAVPGWLVSRSRLAPRRPATVDEELAGHTAAMLALGVVALLVVATNAFALLFLLPSLHIWLWLPQVRDRGPGARVALLAAGLLGPFILVGSFMFRFGLGLDAPWYLAELAALDYVSLVAVLLVLCWLAGAAQLTALAAGRYAPYPSAAERPPRGPIRNSIRALVLTARSRSRATARDDEALGL
ncbi:MAG TPA: M28 family peptidase [Gaiellaceae bacterium]|nr:M28 family peptidase [Gaiellaceae bacterium]